MIINKFKKKLGLFHWNIGFIEGGIKSVMDTTERDITWLKHPYRDRFFADPFLLKCDDNVIEVLVEEFFYKNWKGVITQLTIDRASYRLIARKSLLDLPTHLSFPFIHRENGNVYVLPENAKSLRSAIYLYDEANRELTKHKVLLNEPTVDPAIIKHNGLYYLFATRPDDNPNSNLYAYHSDSLLGTYTAFASNPIKRDSTSSRPAGGFFYVGNELYRAAQNCKNSYGEGISINKIATLTPEEFTEKIISRINSPVDQNNYKHGFHTLNVMDSLCVIDGLKYLYNPWPKLKHIIRGRV